MTDLGCEADNHSARPFASSFHQPIRCFPCLSCKPIPAIRQGENKSSFRCGGSAYSFYGSADSFHGNADRISVQAGRDGFVGETDNALDGRPVAETGKKVSGLLTGNKKSSFSVFILY